VPGFETIIGQHLPVRFLQTLLSNAIVPHALLFTGLPGVGKRTTARIVAMALNCREKKISPSNPCGQCRSCRHIAAGNHPDLLVIEPQGKVLRVDQIRKLLGALSMKPFSAEQRVVIVADAQAMNPEAANALLKMLEEPPANTTVVLTALEKSDLLPTIVSRCRHIRFNPLGPKELAALLGGVSQIEQDFIGTAVSLAGGSYFKARQLAMPAWRDLRNWLIRAAGLDRAPLPGQRSMTSALAFAAQLSQKKDQVSDLLEILKTWIRDLSILPYQPALVINSDLDYILDRARNGLDDIRLLAIWQAVEKAQKDIAAKANLRLTLDLMALSMAGYTRL
jgi:DNA polymerase III subunit delta'